MEDELEFLCPCCSATLGLDEAGDLYPIELPALEANESRGLAGLKVSHSGTTPEEMKLFNQQGKKARVSLLDVPVLGNDPRALAVEAELAQANEIDLDKRNIKPRPRKN